MASFRRCCSPSRDEPYLLGDIEDEAIPGYPIGTLMLSLAVERPFGVARNTDVTIVRIPPALFSPEELMAGQNPHEKRPSTVDFAFALVYNDILEKMETNGGDAGANYRSVIAFPSWMVIPTFPEDWLNNPNPDRLGDKPVGPSDHRFVLYTWMKSLVDLGVVVVAASGDVADPQRPIDGFTMRTIPAVWSSNALDDWKDDDIPLIVSEAQLISRYCISYSCQDMANSFAKSFRWLVGLISIADNESHVKGQ
jgi:hypothetical protein